MTSSARKTKALTPDSFGRIADSAGTSFRQMSVSPRFWPVTNRDRALGEGLWEVHEVFGGKNRFPC